MKEAFPYKRLKDWPSRWVRFIKDSQDLGDSLRLDWESMNCLMWSCMGVEAITGHNPYDMFDPQAESLMAVVKVIKERGYDNLDQILEEHWHEVPIGMAQQGDLVLVEADWEASAAVKAVMPHGTALVDPPFFYCVRPEGLAKGDLYLHGVRAFAIGRII